MKLKEAERLLRGAESLARLANSLLHAVNDELFDATTRNDSSDVVIGDSDSNTDQTAPSSGKQSQWRRRRKKSAQTGVPVEEVLALTDVADVEPDPAAAVAPGAIELTGTGSRRKWP